MVYRCHALDYRLFAQQVWIVFGFVAVWHDVESKLFAWGAMNAFFMTFEQVVGAS